MVKFDLLQYVVEIKKEMKMYSALILNKDDTFMNRLRLIDEAIFFIHNVESTLNCCEEDKYGLKEAIEMWCYEKKEWLYNLKDI